MNLLILNKKASEVILIMLKGAFEGFINVKEM